MIRPNLPGSLRTKTILLCILTIIILGILLLESKKNSYEPSVPAPTNNQTISLLK